MPSLTRSPSMRMTFTTIRPSMTMVSFSFRESTSISSKGLGIAGQRQRMMEGILRGVGGDDLFSPAALAVVGDGSLQVDRRPPGRAQRDDSIVLRLLA